MSFFCTIEKSMSGPLVSSINSRQLLPFLYPFEYQNDRRRHVHFSLQRKNPENRQTRICAERSTHQLDTWFINSLVKAGQCKQHAQPKSHELRSAARRPVSICHSYRSRHGLSECRGFFTQCISAAHSASLDKVKAGREPDQKERNTREELLSLVDTYDSDSLTDHLPLLELPDLQHPPQAQKARLIVSNDPVDAASPPKLYTWPAHGQARKDVEALAKLIENDEVDPEEVYRLYRVLPAPRIPYLSSGSRHLLLHHLSIVEHKDEASMLRYFSVVDDLKALGIPLTVQEWTTAISFAGRYVARTTDIEVEAGLRMWREMEHISGVQGNHVTFNVLFDIASKAGKFKLAEMIYTEMQNRGHAYNRYHHVSLIHFYGLKRDGTGARQAYKQLVEAGEIVDTVVLNAIITALIRAYESPSAELVYERMKRLHAERPDGKLQPTNFKKKREIGKILIQAAEFAKTNPASLEKAQKSSIVAPDIQTYKALVGYYAVDVGEFDKVSKYLEEMNWFEVPLNAGIFLSLFKGFAIHGGVRYTHWTSKRLDSVWNAFMMAVSSHAEGVYLGRWIIIWALRAFAKCSGREKVIDAWEECKMTWEPQGDELQIVNGFLQQLLETNSVPSLPPPVDDFN